MAVKIIIKRKISGDREAKVLPLLLQMRSQAMTQPGYISGETLRDMENPENVLVISTWQSAEVWKAWSNARQRTEIAEKIDAILGQRTEYNIYLYG